jgi:hypothetical protein
MAQIYSVASRANILHMSGNVRCDTPVDGGAAELAGSLESRGATPDLCCDCLGFLLSTHEATMGRSGQPAVHNKVYNRSSLVTWV